MPFDGFNLINSSILNFHQAGLASISRIAFQDHLEKQTLFRILMILQSPNS